jgi:hypothetical protein
MAGPLSGVPGQSVPLSSPFQPGANNAQQVRTEDQKPQENRVQAKNAAAANAQDSQASKKRDDKQYDERQAARLSDDERANARRGSLVDISV